MKTRETAAGESSREKPKAYGRGVTKSDVSSASLPAKQQQQRWRPQRNRKAASMHFLRLRLRLLRMREGLDNHVTMMCGAEKRTVMVAIIVNRVKMIRHILSITIAANFQSFVIFV